MANSSHIPVMISEVLDFLRPEAGQVIVDATFGRGGYSEAILNKTECRVIAIDRDPEAASEGEVFKKKFAERFDFLEGSFSHLNSLLYSLAIKEVDSIVLDLGVSSPQLETPSRGFSFKEEGPLDMRMSQKGPTVGELIVSISEEKLANILFEYGEERQSRAIARAIIEKRRVAPLNSTIELANIVRKVLGGSGKGLDPATKTFMALRIYINNEMEELRDALKAAEKILKPDGRLVVVTFHSLEDRIVKNFFHELIGKTKGNSRYLPSSPLSLSESSWSLLTRKVITASSEEIQKNPRARSAKLRAIKKQAKSHYLDLPKKEFK